MLDKDICKECRLAVGMGGDLRKLSSWGCPAKGATKVGVVKFSDKALELMREDTGLLALEGDEPVKDVYVQVDQEKTPENCHKYKQQTASMMFTNAKNRKYSTSVREERKPVKRSVPDEPVEGHVEGVENTANGGIFIKNLRESSERWRPVSVITPTSHDDDDDIDSVPYVPVEDPLDKALNKVIYKK